MERHAPIKGGAVAPALATNDSSGKSDAAEHGPRRMHPITLAFPSQELEREFAFEYYVGSIRQLRYGLLVAFVLYGVFGVLDGSIIPNVSLVAWVIRYTLVCPLMLGVVLLTYRVHSPYMIQFLSAALGLLAGAGIIVMIILAPPPGNHLYYAGLLLVCTYVYVFVRLRFIVATAISWALVITYEFAAIFIADTPTAIVMSNTFFLFAMNVIGMSACYSLERHLRYEFIHRRTIEDRNTRLNYALFQADEARQEAETLARVDSLTGLFNRRYFFGVGELEIQRSSLVDSPLSLLMIDIDHFKAVNDRFGHLVGDSVLQIAAERLRAGTRKGDVICRYGGEEFAVMLPETAGPDAEAIAERLREGMESKPFLAGDHSLAVTVSIGICSLAAPATESLPVLVEQADGALYRAKEAGRNRVEVSGLYAS